MSSNTPAKADDPTSSVPALPGDLGAEIKSIKSHQCQEAQ